MDSLSSTARTYGQFKKKKKAAAATGQSLGQKSPTTPPSPISPTTAVARSLPSVPSVSVSYFFGHKTGIFPLKNSLKNLDPSLMIFRVVLETIKPML